ncbi:DUF4937 domain-containing protein [uncultured Shewanella sp.]|uniref:DUF4937 domain-containing protein n=1 Tax=uncultured Shewanella sp. TaxID=173975 RepID=UPI0026376C9D|nr:DUF4937 domain-containing protein [uncultured Shewanella sp.]
MIVKWIDVLPIKGQEQAFSIAQEAWATTNECTGFSGQLGGWTTAQRSAAASINESARESGNPHSRAMLLAFWHDMPAIEDFMVSKHDLIAHNNQQAQTYEACLVHYLSLELSLNDLALQQSLQQAIIDFNAININDIGFIRIADCTLKTDEHEWAEHAFFQDQIHVWNPAMQACEGMLGGAVARFQKEKNRFLVISFWQNELCHHKYCQGAFKAAKRQVNLAAYMDKLTGHYIVIEPKWHIEKMERERSV